MSDQAKGHPPNDRIEKIAAVLAAYPNSGTNYMRIHTPDPEPAPTPIPPQTPPPPSALDTPAHNQALIYINQCENREALQALIAAAETRLATLPQQREAKLMMYKGVWFVQTGQAAHSRPNTRTFGSSKPHQPAI